MTQPSSPWIQTASGKAFDLLRPDPAMIDLENDIAGPLARLARFSGHIASGPYSVAQHSVEGADALLRETGDERLAALFLLHDAHEAYLGDLTTPVQAALVDLADDKAGAGAGARLHACLALLRGRVDEAIHAAAGIEMPSTDESYAIKAMDIRMLITERNHLLGPAPCPWPPVFEAAQPIRRNGRLRAQPWPDAAADFMTRARRWLPAFNKALRQPALNKATPGN